MYTARQLDLTVLRLPESHQDRTFKYSNKHLRGGEECLKTPASAEVKISEDKDQTSAPRHVGPDVWRGFVCVCGGGERAIPQRETLGVEVQVHLSYQRMSSELIETISLLPRSLLHFNVDSNDRNAVVAPRWSSNIHSPGDLLTPGPKRTITK